jgi:hypothetical protein
MKRLLFLLIVHLLKSKVIAQSSDGTVLVVSNMTGKIMVDGNVVGENQPKSHLKRKQPQANTITERMIIVFLEKLIVRLVPASVS